MEKISKPRPSEDDSEGCTLKEVFAPDKKVTVKKGFIVGTREEEHISSRI